MFGGRAFDILLPVAARGAGAGLTRLCSPPPPHTKHTGAPPGLRFPTHCAACRPGGKAVHALLRLRRHAHSVRWPYPITAVTDSPGAIYRPPLRYRAWWRQVVDYVVTLPFTSYVGLIAPHTPPTPHAGGLPARPRITLPAGCACDLLGTAPLIAPILVRC